MGQSWLGSAARSPLLSSTQRSCTIMTFLSLSLVQFTVVALVKQLPSLPWTENTSELVTRSHAGSVSSRVPSSFTWELGWSSRSY